MASYQPHAEASDIRFSYSMYGGPTTASFLVPNARVSLFALGSLISIGEHWRGEVVSHEQSGEYLTRIVCSGLARRLDSIEFRQWYNFLLDDGVTEHPFNNETTDAGEILDEVAPLLTLVGLSAASLTVGFNPVQVEVSGPVRSVLDTLAYAAGKGWYIDQSNTIQWGSWALSPASPTLTTIENVRNVLIIEAGRKKDPFDKSSVPEEDVPLEEFLYLMQIVDVNSSGYTGETRFHSDQIIFIAHDSASRSSYGTREERLSVPYIGDSTAALAFATQWFSIFANPIESEAEIEYIESPGPGAHESLPHEKAAMSVDVAVLETGALEVTYNVSMGELMASPLMRGNLQRPFEVPRADIDVTPPRVEMTSELVAPRTNPIPSDIKVYVRAEDEKLDGTKTIETPVIQITTDPADFSIATELNGTPVAVPPAAEEGWYEFTFDLRNSPFNLNRGDPIAYRAKAVDASGNVGYSSVVEGNADSEQPEVSFSVSEYDYGEGAERAEQPTGLKAGLGTIVVTVSDISKISRVHCTHGTLSFVPGEKIESPIDGSEVETQDRWEGTISVSGVEKVSVYAEDVYGNIGEKWEYFWNMDDPMPPEWDKTPPTINVSTSPDTNDSRTVVGHPLKVYARVIDNESGPSPEQPTFQFSINGVDFTNYSMTNATHPDTGDPLPGWHMINFNLTPYSRGQKVWYRVRGRDLGGNYGYSEIIEGVVDDKQPEPSMSVASWDGAAASPSQPKGLKNGRGLLTVTVQDASSISRVDCTHGTLTFIPGTEVIDPVSGDEVTTSDRWEGEINVSGVEKVIVTAYDVFGNVGEDWEYYWNTDDVMPPEWDKTPPEITMAAAPSSMKPTVLGHPLLIFAQIVDKESGPSGLPWLEVSTDGLVFSNVGTFVSPAIHPETGDPYPDWAMISYDLTGYSRGEKIWYRVGGQDVAENTGYSAINEGVVDDQQPQVTFSIEELGSGTKDRQPTGLKHGQGKISVMVTDASTIDHVTCSHATLSFVPGTETIDPVTGDPVKTNDRWEGTVSVSGVEKVIVTAVDIFGNSGSDWEWFWNSDDPMDPIWDKTAPDIQMSSSPSAEKPSVIGSLLRVFGKGVDKESGMSAGMTLQLSLDGLVWGFNETMTTPAYHPETGDPYPDWYEGTFDMTGWPRGTRIYYRVMAQDIAGNVGYSSVGDGVLDDQQPEVTLNVSEYDYGSGGERSKQPTGLKHGLGTLEVTINDASTIVHVWCDSLVGGAGTLTFVPGTEMIDPVTGDPVKKSDRWVGVIQVYSVQKVTVRATDVFGNIGEDWEYFWNTDDPMPPEWDKTGPSVSVANSPSNSNKPAPVGSPFVVFALPTDAETGVDTGEPVELEVSLNGGLDFDQSFEMSSPAYDPETGDPYPDWYQVSVDLKGAPLNLSRGDYFWYRVRATDLAGNDGYSGVQEARVDDDPPIVTVTIDKDPGEADSEKQPTGLAHGFGWVTVKVDDISVIDSVTCDRASLSFVPGGLDSEGKREPDTWQGKIDPPISGVELVTVRVVDTFGNSTEESDYYWNTDDPMPIEFDKRGPIVSQAMNPSASRKDTMGIGSPLIVYARAEDRETDIDEDTYVLEIGLDGIDFPYQHSMAPVGPAYPDWYKAEVDIKVEHGFSSGDLIFYRTKCDDIAGNTGYSTVVEGNVDGIPPTVAVRAQSYDAGATGDEGTEYDEVKGDLRFRITVTDASAVKLIEADPGTGSYGIIWQRSVGDTPSCYRDPDDVDGNAWLYDTGRDYKGKKDWKFRVTDYFDKTGSDGIKVDHRAKDETTSDNTTQEIVEGLGEETDEPDIDGTHIMVGTLPLDRLAEAVEGVFTRVIGADTYKLEFVLDDEESPNHAKMILTRNGVEQVAFQLWNGNPLHRPFLLMGADTDGGRVIFSPKVSSVGDIMMTAENWYIRQDGRSTLASRAYFTDD